MTGLQTYWLADPDGFRAPAEGAARRDELVAAGWVLTDEPRDGDQVWAFNAGLNTFARLGFGALPAFEARGWKPTPPPMKQGDTAPFIALPEPGTPAPVTDASKAQPELKAPAVAEIKKEKDRA